MMDYMFSFYDGLGRERTKGKISFKEDLGLKELKIPESFHKSFLKLNEEAAIYKNQIKKYSYGIL